MAAPWPCDEIAAVFEREAFMPCTIEKSETLCLLQEPSGFRHYLDDRALHAGDALWMKMKSWCWEKQRYVGPSGAVNAGYAWVKSSWRWEKVRYEWSFRPDEDPFFVRAEGELIVYAGQPLKWD
jgi:hypothetical protein